MCVFVRSDHQEFHWRTVRLCPERVRLGAEAGAAARYKTALGVTLYTGKDFCFFLPSNIFLLIA